MMCVLVFHKRVSGVLWLRSTRVVLCPVQVGLAIFGATPHASCPPFDFCLGGDEARPPRSNGAASRSNKTLYKVESCVRVFFTWDTDTRSTVWRSGRPIRRQRSPLLPPASVLFSCHGICLLCLLQMFLFYLCFFHESAVNDRKPRQEDKGIYQGIHEDQVPIRFRRWVWVPGRV